MKKLNTNKQSIIQRLLESPPRGGAWMRMFFMLVIMMMTSAFAMAQDSYGFKIADVEVTSENCKDLSVIREWRERLATIPRRIPSRCRMLPSIMSIMVFLLIAAKD